MNDAAFGSTVGTAVENDAAHEFDFQAHADRAVNEYLKVQAFYLDLSESIRRIIEESLRRHDIKVHSIQARAKDPRSLGKKASRPPIPINITLLRS